MSNDSAFDIALTSATTSPGIFPPEQQSIAYNAFDKVTSITEGNKSLQITYGHHRQRIRQQYTAAGSTTNKVYAGACEYITTNGQTTTHTYLNGPEGLFALHVKNPNGSENIRYIHMDHLGSWNTISDENGNLLQELSFDAWGNRRNSNTWRAFASTPPEPLFERGFTGHEHLYGFQLINMNGRMYDPVVSRMLSPDNFIQAPDFSQSFNRYSYAWNNPLKYTDPDGEIIVESLILLGMTLAGGYLGGVASNEGELNPAKWDWRSETTYLGIGFGGLFGYVGGYGLINPGTVGLSLGVGTPAAGIYLTGQGSDWKFQWTTSAGGGGDINLSQPVTSSDVFNGSNHRVKLPVVPNITSNTYFDDATQRWSNYASGMIFADLPEIEVKWDGIEGDAATNVPYWWGMTDLMANPLTQSRVMNKGVEAMFLPLAISGAVILGAESYGFFATYRSYTLLRFGGKNRVDFSTDKWLLHYHRRGIGPGQGIGRHRPWQYRPSVEKWWEIWKRF